MSTYVQPTVKHHVSANGYDYGYEIEFQRISVEFGERASSFTIGELTVTDLEVIQLKVADALKEIAEGKL